MSSLAAVLLAHCDEASGQLLAALPDLDAILSAMLQAARTAWPNVVLSDATFVQHLAEKITKTPNPKAALRDLRAADLYLACACAQGDKTALACLEATYATALSAGVAHAPRSLAAEVNQTVRERLFVARPPERPRIAEYGGHGDLGSWLRVVALRVGLNLIRAEHPREKLDLVLLDTPQAGEAELEIFKQMYSREFRAAFAQAASHLTPRERNVLRHHYIDGLAMDRIGSMYGVHRMTVQRWTEAARRRLAAGTLRALAVRLGVAPGELDSIMRLIRSQLDVSVRTLMAEEP
jgi:RNA polymerase sigma-70 factor (ECF subfamily)